jgi:hypothetical protein
MNNLYYYIPLMICLAIIAGSPNALVRLYIYRRELNRRKESPMWSAWELLQNELAKTLHHPHPEAQEMDGLLIKLQGLTEAGLSQISDLDRTRLTVLLREKVDDPSQTKDERLRAQFLLFAMPRAQEQQKESVK